MKLFLSLILLTFSASAQAAATPAEIARKVEWLGKLAYGTNQVVAEGANAEEMVISYAMEESGEEREYVLENFLRNPPTSELSFGDMIGFGTLDLDAAIWLYQQDDGSEGETEKKQSAKARVGVPILKELSKMGLKFGYTPHASSYCGISFMGLLIVDEKNQKIHQVSLTNSDGC